MMTIKNAFDLKQTVYLKTDPDQLPRIVVGIDVRPGELIYALACGQTESPHYDFEISAEKNVLAEYE